MSDAFKQAVAAGAEGDTETVRRLAGLHAGGAQGEQRLEWCFLLLEAGHEDDAAKLAADLPPGPLRERWLAVAGDGPDDDPGDLDAPDEDEVDLRPLEAGAPDARVVELFLRFFGGRKDLYARQWYDETRRRSGYHPVHAPLTDEVVRAHLEGRQTIGQYLLWPDATVSFAVIDLDLEASALAALRAGYGDDVSALRHDGLRRHLRRVLEACASLGVACFAEDSGGRGAHVWIFFEPRRSARAARALLSQIVMAAGAQPADVNVELFPKQSQPGRRGLSSLVKLPLGIHRVTMRQCPLLDAALRPLEDPRAALELLRPAEPSLLDAVLGRRLVPLPAPDLVSSEPPAALPDEQTPRALGEALRAVGEGKEERVAFERVLAGCPALARVVSKAYGERSLTADEARAVSYTLGLIGAKGDLTREVLVAAGASLKELDRARRGLPSPAGCKRIRTLQPDGHCPGCPSGSNALPYATPVLHAVGPRAPSPPRHVAFAPWLGEGELVQSPLAALGEALERIEDRLERLEGAARDPGVSRDKETSG